MSDGIPVFVNGTPVQVAQGSSARSAVAKADADLGAKLSANSAYLTDGRGIRMDADAPVHAGAILRVIVSARAAADEEADASA